MFQIAIDFLNDVRGALVSTVAGAFIATSIKFSYDIFQQRKINKAIAKKDIGINFANLVYTNHQRSKTNNIYTQRLRTVTSKLDLAKIFNGKAQGRYLEYLSKATELACRSENNPYVPDYIEQAIKDCHSGFWQTAINVFAKIDATEIRRDMLRAFKLGVAEYLQDRATEYPRLFDGDDFEKFSGTTLFPMLVGEKESKHQQVKIVLMRQHDLLDNVIPNNSENVNVRTAKSTYRYDPDHRDMLRWRTNIKLKEKLKDADVRAETGIQINLPVVLQMATQEQRDKVGMLPPPSNV